MADVTNPSINTTTISLNEYNGLKSEALSLRETKGALQTTIDALKLEVGKLNEKQPSVKVIHMTKEWETDYDGYGDEIGDKIVLRNSKIEFANLLDVQNMAIDQAKTILKEQIETTNSDIKNQKSIVKSLRTQIEEVNDTLELKNKELSKLKTAYNDEVTEKAETYNKNIEYLKKAQKEDEKEYKDTIKELKDEIQKVKDSKTDAEIEEKRNKEIKDLKSRIKDLEGMIEDLGKLNFFKRMFRLRTISAEKLAVQIELEKREQSANKVGTTWVKENGKYRKYDRFHDALSNMQNRASDYGRDILNYFYTSAVYGTSAKRRTSYSPW